MKRYYLLGLFLGGLLAGRQAVCSAEIAIAQNGQSDYGIVVPYYADKSIWAAALDLAAILEEASGAVYPVYTDMLPADGTEIVIGAGNTRLTDWHLDAIGKDFEAEEYEIRSYEKNVVIIGGPGRGTINGIYGFCQDHIGCRWLTPGCQYVPKKETILFETLQDRQKPAFRWRSTDSAMQWDANWYVRNRFNEYKAWVGGPRPSSILQQEGDLRTRGMANAWNPHGFQDIPEPVYAAQPEWRAERNGQRVYVKDPVARGFCMTNPEFIHWIAEWTKDKIQQDPQVQFVSITNADNDTICQCSSCKMMAEKVGGSGTYVEFVNQVAQHVSAEFPAVKLVALAYHHTFAPNPVQVHANVHIVWAPISADYAWGIDQGEVNHTRDYVGQLAHWAKNAPSLGIWLYQYSLDNLIARPMLNGAQRTLQVFRDKGINQVFIEMAFGPCQKDSWGTDGDKSLTAYANAEDYYRPKKGYKSMLFPYGMEHLRGYIYARLLWNPAYNLQEGMREFCHIYYGPAGSELAEFALLEEDIQNYDQTVGPTFKDYAGIHMDLSDVPRMKYEMVQKSHELMEQAIEKVRREPLYGRRTELARMGVDLMLMTRMETKPAVRQEALSRFVSLAEEIKLAGPVRVSGVGFMNLEQLQGYVNAMKPE